MDFWYLATVLFWSSARAKYAILAMNFTFIKTWFFFTLIYTRFVNLIWSFNSMRHKRRQPVARITFFAGEFLFSRDASLKLATRRNLAFNCTSLEKLRAKVFNHLLVVPCKVFGIRERGVRIRGCIPSNCLGEWQTVTFSILCSRLATSRPLISSIRRAKRASMRSCGQPRKKKWTFRKSNCVTMNKCVSGDRSSRLRVVSLPSYVVLLRSETSAAHVYASFAQPWYKKVWYTYIYHVLLATDKAKVVRELTQHVRETTSEVSEQDIGESTLRRKLKLSWGLLVYWFVLRGTQRLFSVRRSKNCLEFSIAWGRLKISRWPFHSCTIFVIYLINSLRFSIKFNFSHFSTQVSLFFVEKRNLKCSDSKMRWREESEKFSPS